MSRQDFFIEGGVKLKGEIAVYGSKNAALPLIAASLLTSEEVKLSNIPPILDVVRLIDMIKAMGVDANYANNVLKVKAKEIKPSRLSAQEVGLLRGSVLLLGALLGRFRQAELPLPGGDIIGARPIDTHLDVFRQLGGEVREGRGKVNIEGQKMKAGKVVLREFSVTATENALLVAATLPGVTEINIAAAEPHVVALARLLSKMGAKISGAGTHTIKVQGTKDLHGAKFVNIPDMLEAGFFILVAAATKSSLKVKDVPINNLLLFFKKLDEIGVEYEIDTQTAEVKVRGGRNLKAFTMQSLPHPGIPTDLQAPFSVMATQTRGSSLIHDPLYEGRLKHILELQKMGAKAIICDPHRVIINGPSTLKGRKIPSLDIRSGATLVLAGLIAQGQTVIEGAEVIDRGYANLAERLQAIGAKIERR
jgi:UDP-N-acetylglucosamine 1-carboxyvinyltransferase